MSEFGAIVLAAGLSKRMGGPNKLLQPYLGKPLLSHTLQIVAGLGLFDCLAVTGRDASLVEGLASEYGLRCVHNPSYAEGLGSSIAAGVAKLNARISGLFIVLGDMPEVSETDYRLLALCFRQGAIAVPVYKGRRGHPALFCSSYRDQLASLTGDEGGRSILARNAGAIIPAETSNSGVLVDFDSPQDFGNLSPA